MFQALADPSRRAILESPTRSEAAVKDLTARFDISQPSVSQHLAALKDAGLVNGRREGRCVYYRVEPRGMKPLIDWITPSGRSTLIDAPKKLSYASMVWRRALRLEHDGRETGRRTREAVMSCTNLSDWRSS